MMIRPPGAQHRLAAGLCAVQYPRFVLSLPLPSSETVACLTRTLLNRLDLNLLLSTFIHFSFTPLLFTNHPLSFFSVLGQVLVLILNPLLVYW